ncbi:ABC transporter permease [Aquibacillus rhizosphaerae]|uniref:ABC transporter permease n=1 Tax=Aquibacillus rhizosphaerae TaxID=3051431 RepID=A0ABT7L5V3_9BACI|nr:ABC transporter permease [Aquibacillus sp. LR5S19]MDL4841243.1 ABC transporter permease [Aquibacillus sp. LR5S19]
MFSAILAIVRKDLLLIIRKPMFSIISLIVPLLFIIFYGLVIHTSSTNPIVIANHSEGPYTERFVDILQEIKSVDGSYLEIITLDSELAYEKYNNRQVDALLVIPESFEENLHAGKQAALKLKVFNINSDGTKNYQLRIDHALYEFHKNLNGDSFISINEDMTFIQDTPMKSYVSTGLLIFSVLLTSMVSTGTLMAREWEERTAKLIVLTPKGFLPLIVGKWMTALLVTVANTVLVLPLLYILLGYLIGQMNTLVWFYLLLFFFYGSAAGVLLGVLFKKTLPIVPISIVIAMSEFLVSSLESYIRGFAHGGMTEWLWRLGSWWPSSEIIDRIRFTVEDLEQIAINWGASFYMALWVGLLLTIALFKLNKQLSFTQGQ